MTAEAQTTEELLRSQLEEQKIEEKMMKVVLSDGSIHEVDAGDVALLLANRTISMDSLPSRGMFTRFAEFVTKHRAVPQPEGLAVWDREFMDQILDAETLNTFGELARMIGQTELTNLCITRAAELGVEFVEEDYVDLMRRRDNEIYYGNIDVGNDAGAGEVDNNIDGGDGGSTGGVEDAGQGGGIGGDGTGEVDNNIDGGDGGSTGGVEDAGQGGGIGGDGANGLC